MASLSQYFLTDFWVYILIHTIMYNSYSSSRSFFFCRRDKSRKLQLAKCREEWHGPGDAQSQLIHLHYNFCTWWSGTIVQKVVEVLE